MEIGGPRRRRRRRRGGGGGGGGPGGGQGQQPPQGQQGNPQGQGAQGGQYQSQGQFQGQGQSQGQSQGQGQFQGQGQPPQGQRAPQQQPRYPQNNGQNQGQNQGQFQGNGQHQGQHQGHHQGHGGNGQQARANQAAQNNQRHMKAGGLPPLPDGVKPWADLTVIDPQPRITLEYAGCPASCRLIDLFCPIGRGQRSLIVSPPKAGKTTLLKDIALAVLRNHPGIELVVLLIDERPEEVTDFRRTLAGYEERLAADLAWAQNAAKDLGMHVDQVASDPSRTQAIVGGFGAQIVSPRCKIIASSNDHGTDQHVSVAMKAAEYCKRQVELGKHVVMLLDSMRGHDGKILVEGFYDDVRALTDAEREQIAAIPYDETEYKAAIGVDALFGEPGYTARERIWARPTLELNGIWGGFQGVGHLSLTTRAARTLRVGAVADQHVYRWKRRRWEAATAPRL